MPRTVNRWAGWLILALLLVQAGDQLNAQITIQTTEENIIPANQGVPARRNVAPEDVELDPFLLGSIQHRSLRVRESESDAYYQVLDFAKKGNYEQQKRVARETAARHERHFRSQPANARVKFSLFVDLFQHPEEYTGELLFFRGYARKMIKHPLDPEDPDAPQTYEAWIYSPDSQHNPIVIVCAEIPENMPQGGNIVETVEVAGYFFKVMGYHAQDTLRAAPLLLAKKLEWIPRTKSDFSFERSLYFLITGGFVLAIILVYWRMSRRNMELLSKKTLEPEDFDPADLKDLDLSQIAVEPPPATKNMT